MGRKIYMDYMSQPARAVIIFCRANNIQADVEQVLIHKGQHRTPEYKALNPLGKIPCLVEDDFVLAESAAILRYLANTNNVPDHWYPAEPRRRARIDSALDWHHSNTRKGGATLVMNRVFAESLGRRKDSAAAAEAEALLTVSLQRLERFWLKSSSFIAGEEISIADLLIVTELDMLHTLAGASEGKNMDELLAPFPKVRDWMNLVAETLWPHHQEASKILMLSAAKLKQKKAQQQAKL